MFRFYSIKDGANFLIIRSDPNFSELEEEFTGRKGHFREFSETTQQAPELAQAHGGLFGHPIPGTSIYKHLAVLGMEFDFHAFAHLLPGLLQKVGLVTSEAALGSSRQILHGWIAGPHFSQGLFGGNASG